MIQLLSYGTSKHQNYGKYHIIWTWTYHHEKNDTWTLIYVFVLTSVPLKWKKLVWKFLAFVVFLWVSNHRLRNSGEHTLKLNCWWDFFKGYKFLDLNSVSYDLLKAWKVEEKNRLMFHVGKVYCNYNYDYNYTTIICYKSAFCTLLETMKTLQSPS